MSYKYCKILSDPTNDDLSFVGFFPFGDNGWKKIVKGRVKKIHILLEISTFHDEKGQ